MQSFLSRDYKLEWECLEKNIKEFYFVFVLSVSIYSFVFQSTIDHFDLIRR